jgi:uncharacterized membrane protein YgcG
LVAASASAPRRKLHGKVGRLTLLANHGGRIVGNGTAGANPLGHRLRWRKKRAEEAAAGLLLLLLLVLLLLIVAAAAAAATGANLRRRQLIRKLLLLRQRRRRVGIYQVAGTAPPESHGILERAARTEPMLLLLVNHDNICQFVIRVACTPTPAISTGSGSGGTAAAAAASATAACSGGGAGGSSGGSTRRSGTASLIVVVVVIVVARLNQRLEQRLHH